PVQLGGRGIAPRRRQRFHQPPLRALSQRVHYHRPAQVPFRTSQVSPRERLRRQRRQRFQITLHPRLPLLKNPVLGPLFQQRSPVKGDGLLQRLRIAPAQGGFEGGHVDG